MSPKDAKIVEKSFDIKTNVADNNAVFIKDTWPALAPVKFKPHVELDPRQAPDKDADDLFEETFSARIAIVRLTFASLSAQSVDSVEVPPNNLGPGQRLDNANAPKDKKIVGATR